VVAVEDTRVLVIDRRDFLDLLADRPELLTGFFRAVSQQLRTLIDLPTSRQSGELLEVGPQQEGAPPATGEMPIGKG
jgi:CRP-like cAMP-binding protein